MLVYYPPGLPTNVDKTSYPPSPLDTTEDTPPPIPPQQFSVDDILLLPKLSESYKLQQNCRDAPPPLPLKTIQEDIAVPTLTSKTYNENTAVLPLPLRTKQKDDGPAPHHPKTDKKDASLPAPPMVNQKDTTLPPCPPKTIEDGTTITSHTPNESHEGTALAQHLTEQTTVRNLSKFVKGPGYPQIHYLQLENKINAKYSNIVYLIASPVVLDLLQLVGHYTDYL